MLDPADYTVSVTSDGAYNYYAYTYTGAGNNGNPGYLSYNEDYALIIKGAITVADDAVAASVPLTLTTSTPAATATVSGTVTTNIVVPTILSANSAVQGDIDQSATIGLNVWKKDTGDVATLDDLNLAAVRNEGLLRQQVINNTSNAVSGDIYVLAPVGDFTPVLAAVPYATTVNGSASNPTAGTWYYTTDSTVALGSDLSTVTNWIAVTSSVPAGATAFKLSGVTAAPGDRVNLYFDYNIPTTAGENMVVRSHAQIDMVGFVLPSTNYAGFRISKPAYRVNYYKDSVGTVGDTATYLGASGTILKDGTNDLIAGDGITLAAGTTLTSGQLGAKRPAGYQSGVQQGSVPYTLLDATDTVADLVTGNVNIINVLYVPIADYVVSYDTNGGTYDGSTSIADTTGVKWADTKLLPDGASYDTSLIAPPTGYTFSNWRVTTGGPTATATASSTYGSLATDDTTMSITLTAQWAPITYTVVYQKNIVDTSGNALAGTVAGTTVTSTHTYNVARNLTANGYSLKGYTFAGWNTAVDGTGTVYTNAQSVINLASMQDAQIVLYAQWDVTTNNTLTFDPNGGKAGTVNQLTGLEYGQMLGAQSQVLPSTTAGTAPTRAGYVFQGWTTSASASAPDFSIANTVDWVGDKVVYAVWTPDNVNYKVENYLVNSDGATVKLADTISYQALTGSTVTASPRSYTGYDYKAGYTNGAYKEIKSGVVKADGSLVLKLYYVTQYVPPTPPTPPTPPGPDNLTVTFVNWDGTVLKIQVVPRGGDATAPAVPGRAGYIFTGWDRGYTNVQENIIVTALFKPIIPETPTTSTPGGGGGGGGGGGATISPANPPTSPGSGPGTMTITSGGAPLGSGHNWSLFSLMLSVAGVLMALLLLVYMPMRRRRFNEERNELERFGLLTDEAEDEINERRKRGRVARLLAVIVGAVTLIVWLILDWPLDNMVWINSHTFIVAILFIVNLALTALYNARKRKPDEWEDYRTANVK
ncbi:MAG: InlB B-repeat-containing protein [Clostridiales bacterium]|nr:InlB B-repeat-containing protein [Clostridiales bacterium]